MQGNVGLLDRLLAHTSLTHHSPSFGTHAQIHTAEGEDQEAVKVLDALNRLNLHQEEEEETAATEQARRDVCCLDPSGLVECLMLKGDLLVEISQAEGKAEQIRLQSMALQCFTRASDVSLWLLRQVTGDWRVVVH